MGMFYYYGDYDDTPQIIYAASQKWFRFKHPSECFMLIPGTYAQMLEDYR